MSRFSKLAHAVWLCKYHIVWCTKYRFKVLNKEIRVSVRDILRQLCEWKKVEIIEGKCAN